MKTLLSMLCLLVLLLGMALNAPLAIAGDVTNGAKVFANNCAACHMGGGNAVNAAKTLRKSDLETYAMFSQDAIKTQVTNGKLAMPAFKGRLTDAEIADVASYVLAQSEKGW